jgi:AraC family transcriptional regulator
MEYRERIQATIDYIEEHLSETISLCELAELACFSEFHYHRMFQWMVGVTVMDYIRKRRLSQAVVALRESKRRVVDVALDYGF